MVDLIVIAAVVLAVSVLITAMRYRRRTGLDQNRYQPPRVARPGDKSGKPEKALPFHEDVHFTVYPPSFVRPGHWAPVLAFAHLGAPPVGGDPRDDPIRRVRELAEATLGPQIAKYTPMAQGSRRGLPEEAEITFELDLPGFDVERPHRTFRWIDAFAMEKFQIRTGAQLDGQTTRGRLVIYHGSFLLGEVLFFIHADAQASNDNPSTGPPASAAAYRKLFASYSHEDTAIVEEFERHFAAIGDVYLRDVRMLRSGEQWNPRLLDFIRQADVFQLFWSHNAMRSPYVEQEWRFALSLGRTNFIRPTYWEQPMPKGPGLPPDELGDIHFHALGTALAVTEPPATATGSPPPPAHWDEPDPAPTVSARRTPGAAMRAPTIGNPPPPTVGPYGDYDDAAPMAKGRGRSLRGRSIGAGLAVAFVAVGVTFLGITQLTLFSANKQAASPPTTTAASPPIITTAGPAPVGFDMCPDGHTAVSGHITCDFAESVRDAFFASGQSHTIAVYSPVTGENYAMDCEGEYPAYFSDGKVVKTVRCHPAGSNAEVVIW